MRQAAVIPALSTAHSPPTLAVQADVHDAMLDLHVPAQVSLEVELAGAVWALERLAACMQVHMAQQVVHAVEGLPAHLEWGRHQRAVGSLPSYPIYYHHLSRATLHPPPTARSPFLWEAKESLFGGRCSLPLLPALSWRWELRFTSYYRVLTFTPSQFSRSFCSFKALTPTCPAQHQHQPHGLWGRPIPCT